MRADPKGIDGGINLYAYVQNNPMVFNDPLGLCEIPCCNNCEPRYETRTEKTGAKRDYTVMDPDALDRYRAFKLEKATADAGGGFYAGPTQVFKVGIKYYEEQFKELECLVEICLDKDRMALPKVMGCRAKPNTKPYWAITNKEDVEYKIEDSFGGLFNENY